jgi:hypothetical protein
MEEYGASRPMETRMMTDVEMQVLADAKVTRTFRRTVGGFKIRGAVLGRGEGFVGIADTDKGRAERVWRVRDEEGGDHEILAEEWEVLREPR